MGCHPSLPWNGEVWNEHEEDYYDGSLYDMRCELRLYMRLESLDERKRRHCMRVLQNVMCGRATSHSHRMRLTRGCFPANSSAALVESSSTGSSSSSTTPPSWRFSSQLYLTRAVFYRENRDAFVRGMQSHGWIHLTELSLCPCGVTRPDLELILASLKDQHVHLKKIKLQMRYERVTLSGLVESSNNTVLSLLVELLKGQPNLELLDMTGSYLQWKSRSRPEEHSQHLLNFVQMAVWDHGKLNTLILADSNVDDASAALFFQALATKQQQDHSTKSPHLRHFVITSYFAPSFRRSNSMLDVQSVNCLITSLPYMQSIQTLVFQNWTFHRTSPYCPSLLPDSKDSKSHTWMVGQILFCDRVYQRFQLLHDQLPTSMWPILGYVPELYGDHGRPISAPYFSKHDCVWTQLFLAGFPMKYESNTLQTLLLPNWKDCWQPQAECSCPASSFWNPRRSNRSLSPNIARLQDSWKECSFCFTKSQKLGQQNSFKASALFLLIKEVVAESHCLFPRKSS